MVLQDNTNAKKLIRQNILAELNTFRRGGGHFRSCMKNKDTLVPRRTQGRRKRTLEGSVEGLGHLAAGGGCGGDVDDESVELDEWGTRMKPMGTERTTRFEMNTGNGERLNNIGGTVIPGRRRAAWAFHSTFSY
ncbi:hypothetical protein PM082_009997 [Marasmius tenuissimus]|nr:hypothetical protein PM082_009997 [Marasmius tenuissimus]